MDRITRVWIRNLRSLADVTLELDGLTVLIGENGSGKSSIIEALELLRKCASPGFVDALDSVHGGVSRLARGASDSLVLGVRIEDGSRFDTDLEYEIQLQPLLSSFVVVSHETLREISDDDTLQVVARHRNEARVLNVASGHDAPVAQIVQVASGMPVISGFGPLSTPHPAISRVLSALGAIQVHLPFDTVAGWAATESRRVTLMRGSAKLQPTKSLERMGSNLANAYHALRNDFGDVHWRETMDYVRLGLGDDVESLSTPADAGGGSIALTMKYRQFREQVPAASLSDGTLVWLAFVALFRLSKPGELIAFDEPELHLHPSLLARVVGLFEQLAVDRPIVLTTHSDRLLDYLSAPAKSVVVCELDEMRATRLRRPDDLALRSWLERYSGYGEIRSAGHEASILREPPP